MYQTRCSSKVNFFFKESLHVFYFDHVKLLLNISNCVEFFMSTDSAFFSVTLLSVNWARIKVCWKFITEFYLNEHCSIIISEH